MEITIQNFIEEFSSYHTVNTLNLSYKN